MLFCRTSCSLFIQKKLTKTFKNLTPYGWGVKSRWRTTAGGGGGAHLLAMFWSNVLQHQLNYPPSKFTYSRVLRRRPAVPRSSHEYHNRAPSPTRQLLQLSINDDVRPVPARPCHQQGQQWRFHAGAWRGAQAPPNRGYAPQNSAGPQTVARPPNLAVLLTHRGQLLLRKIGKIDAARCQILRQNAQNSIFARIPTHAPLGELTALPQAP